MVETTCATDKLSTYTQYEVVSNYSLLMTLNFKVALGAHVRCNSFACNRIGSVKIALNALQAAQRVKCSSGCNGATNYVTTTTDEFVLSRDRHPTSTSGPGRKSFISQTQSDACVAFDQTTVSQHCDVRSRYGNTLEVGGTLLY